MSKVIIFLYYYGYKILGVAFIMFIAYTWIRFITGADKVHYNPRQNRVNNDLHNLCEEKFLEFCKSYMCLRQNNAKVEEEFEDENAFIIKDDRERETYIYCEKDESVEVDYDICKGILRRMIALDMQRAVIICNGNIEESVLEYIARLNRNSYMKIEIVLLDDIIYDLDHEDEEIIFSAFPI